MSWDRVLVETRPRRYCLDTWLNSIAVLIYSFSAPAERLLLRV